MKEHQQSENEQQHSDRTSRWAPRRPTFSYTITAVSAAIHHRLATPAANISNISAQQQPKQNSPCPRPSRNACPTPRR